MKKGLFAKLVLFAIIMIIFPKNVHALNFKVERSADTVKPGSEVTVYVKAEGVGNDSLKEYNVSLTYDGTKLEYKSGTSDVATVTQGNPIVITNGNGTISSDTTLATLVFGVKANSKAGDTSLTLTNSGLKTIAGEEKTATNTSSMIKVAALGSDATLSSLKIPNTTLSPKFDKNTLEYTADIKDITEITINAQATDSNAKIMISDNYKSLVKGENIVKISVTAENGTATKTYQIKVNLTMTPTEEEKIKANALLKKLSIEGYDIDFSSDQKKYTLTVPYKEKKVKVLAEAENENAPIEMEGTTSLKIGKNIIKVLVTSEDGSTKETYTLTITREKQEKKVVQTCPDETSTREWIVFSVSMLLTFTLGIVLGYFVCKKEVLRKIFKKKNKKEKPEEIDTLSDTIELDAKKVSDKLIEEKEEELKEDK